MHPSELDEESERATFLYMEHRNKLMTEAVIACWMDTHTPAQTAAILREFADQLEKFE